MESDPVGHRRGRGNRSDGRYRRVGGLPAYAARAVRLGRACLVHPDHAAPVPIETHYVRPRTRGGGDHQWVTLCANAHGRVHALLEEIEAFALTSPYRTTHEVLRHLPVWDAYDVTERAVAYHGWLAYGLGFLNKRYETAHHYWRTDGTPKGPDVPRFDELGHAARWSKRWRRELDAL